MLLFLYGDGCFGFGRFSEKIGSVSYPEKRLFVAQCVDGVQVCGLGGGKQAWAGYHPKKMPVRVQTANERKTLQGWI